MLVGEFGDLLDAGGAGAVTGGRIEGVSRLSQGSNRGWSLRVAPDGDGDVTVGVRGTTSCTSGPMMCTDDGRMLGGDLQAGIAGPPPPALSVADAKVHENDGVPLGFVVSLDRAPNAAVTVDYATSDGSAQAGVDYTAASGTLSFAAGESSKTVEVAVLDDSHDEDEETLTLTLSNASAGVLTDAEATGTIENSDPLPRALVARFGRTAAVHVVEHVEERLAAPREPGFRGRFAGRELRQGMERDLALGFLRRLGGRAGVHPAGGASAPGMPGLAGGGASAAGMPGLGGGAGMAAAGPMGASGLGAPGGSMSGPGPGAPTGLMSGPGGGGLLDMGLGGGDVLTGSAFALNRETRQGGILSFWSRGARSSFHGQEGELGLNGDVRTTMFGADYAKGPLVVGLSLSNNRGLGNYTGVDVGQVTSSVTGLYPWLGYKATDRVTVWGVAGYGAGALMLTPGSGAALESGMSMSMAAAGTRGELIATLHAGRPAVADAERGGGAAARRRGRRDGRRHGHRHRPHRVGHVDGAGGGRTGADAAGAPGRGVLRAGHGAVAELQPDTVDADGLHGEGGAVMGRSGDERGRGAVGPGDDGGHGARRRRGGQPPRRRGRLRAAGGEPLRGDAAGGLQHLGVRPGLPGGLRPRRARSCRSELRAGRRRAAAGEPDAGQRGQQRVPGPGHAGLVERGLSGRGGVMSTDRVEDEFAFWA